MLDEALAVAQKGVAGMPRFSPGFTALGRVQAQRGQWEEAAAAFEKALAIDSESVAALKGLAKVLLRKDQKGEARELLSRAAALKPEDASLQNLLSQLDSSGGEVPSKVVSPGAGPTDQPIATITIAEIYLRQGFLERAAKVYRDLLREDPKNAEIRKKLVDLKKRILEQKGAEQQQKGTRNNTGSVAPAGNSSVAKVRDVAPSSTESEREGEERQVLELNRWLDSIRKRRANV